MSSLAPAPPPDAAPMLMRIPGCAGVAPGMYRVRVFGEAVAALATELCTDESCMLLA